MPPADDLASAWRRGVKLITDALTRFDATTKTQLTDAFRGLMGYTRSWIVREVPTAYDNGRGEARGSPVTDTEAPGPHRDAVVSLTTDLDKRLMDNLVNVGRRTNDIYRRLVDEGLQRGLSRGDSLSDMRADIAERIRKEGLEGYVDSAGRQWTPDAYASMAARTTLSEAHNLGLMNELEEGGYDLVEIPNRDSACPICSKYEGRIYSISGEDTRYPALRGAAFGVAYHTIHPNCQHRLIPYYEQLAVDPEADRRRSNEPFIGVEG